MQWFVDNWQLLALAGGLGGVSLFAAFWVVSKLTPSTSDDEWAAKVGVIVAKVVKLTPTTADDELLDKVNEIVGGLTKK